MREVHPCRLGFKICETDRTNRLDCETFSRMLQAPVWKFVLMSCFEHFN
jgi:hypothetical protein